MKARVVELVDTLDLGFCVYFKGTTLYTSIQADYGPAEKAYWQI